MKTSTKSDCLALVSEADKEKLNALLLRLIAESQHAVYQELEYILYHAGVTCITTWTGDHKGVLLEFYDQNEDPTIEGEDLRELCEKALEYLRKCDE